MKEYGSLYEGHGALLNESQNKENMKEFFLLVVLIVVVVWGLFYFYRFSSVMVNKTKKYPAFTDGEILVLLQTDNLLCATIHNGLEWATLSLSELVEIFHTAVKIMSRGKPTANRLIEMAERCENLSESMEESRKQLQITGLTHLVEKPKNVALQLRALVN